ncbi:MAG: GMC family oxidoreductase [Pseudomonadota bacterium]|nr:GMC family oxidoreductase [Pseudomonadota bacterium]
MADHDADVIVVGSGSLGSLAALQLAKAGKSVIILEAGPVVPDWKITENFRVSPRKGNLNAPFGDIPYAPNSYTPGYLDFDADVGWVPGTLRVAGGTSRHWTGVAWRFLPEEMKMKTLFGIGRDWPLSYADLEPFYTAAEYQVGVNGADETDYSGLNRGSPYPPRSKPYPVPPEAKPYALQRFQMRAAQRGYRVDHAPNVRLSRPYAGRPACIGNNICNPNCPIGAKHSGLHDLEAAQMAGAKLRTGAVVDKLETDSRGRITAVSFLDPKGVRSRLSAKAYVIAAHGFETPKLLLMNGLANRSGMVGRNLMMHPTLSMGFFADEPLWVGRGQYLHGANLQHRLRADRTTVSGGFYQFMNHNAGPAMASALFKEGGRIGATLDKELRLRSSQYMGIQLLLEDLPDPSNMVSVNPSFKDSIGQPGIRVHYRLKDYAKAALPRTIDDYSNWLQAMNAVPQEIPGAHWYNQHHIMGTVIMGSDPSDSVVDKDLRCHDHDNLFLVTTGVFPSVSCVNPTLTGMALAVRAGRHIATEV